MTVVDTQAVLWLTHERELLSAAARDAVAEAESRGELAIAAITLSELAMLVIRRRVNVDQPVDLYLQFVERYFQVVPIDSRIAVQAHRFGPAYPRDPADRLIGATALVRGARLVTSDQGIRASGEVVCVW